MALEQLPSKIDKIFVYSDKQEQGVLTHGSVHHYQPTQTERHVSLTMTKNNLDGYSSGSLHPIFVQNLPEGFNRRFISEKLARYARVNDMYLLALQGDHSIGMLSYQSALNLPETDSVSLEEILTYQSTEPLFPQLLEKYYLRNALAGVQPKVSIPRTERTVEQKDLIVKSFDDEFPLLTVNEYVCMEAARHCGLKPPKTYLSENLETFVVERFDKVEKEKSSSTKLGYEDFNTLLKKPNHPDAKYNGSYESLLRATHIYTNSQTEVRKMYQYIVFNCLIGNGDAHLKNFALQYTSDMQNIFVSPPFDVTHTIIYDTIDNKMALKLANSKIFPDKNHLIKLAESRTFRIRDAGEIIDKMAEDISNYLDSSEEVTLFSGLKESIKQSISKVMSSTYSNKSYRHDKKRKFE
ncbi:type II toxin-antitoxin system HipA family toxin [Vibrio sp. SCSIO 43137]|uniref:type II toxin-antitoxin system HipA family toxin n=1 Tax=Vibrio sp. SCSIO 43137 TaxID=3021011 RepID=UPI0023074B4E|nr:type II toxin-antitoxin system HipA family toxin [Vibrio sp. SCSIO 43137]WCE29333.1 type II toxin-antitoxin system HipA family toxin [Vibrio sp. SCSIO 43137]